MNKIKVIEYEVPRKTLIRGQFTGKFRGILNDHDSALSNRELFYEIEIYEAEIKIKGVEKNFNEENIYRPNEIFLSKLPKTCNCEFETTDGKTIYSKLEIHEPHITSATICNVVKEGNISFGVLKGIISGHILDFVTVKEEILEEPPLEKVEDNPRLTKVEDYNKNKDSKTKNAPLNVKGLFSSFYELIGLLIAAYLIISFLLLIGWQGMVGLLIIGGIALLFNFLPFLFNAVLWSLRILFVMLLLFGFLMAMTKDFQTPTMIEPLETPEETSTITEYPTIDEESTETVSDSIISHHRVWKDYNENLYAGDLKVFKSDFITSRENRVFYDSNISSEIEIAGLYNHLLNFDENKLDMVVDLFDSLRIEKGLSKMEFANCMVSCIQDVPYVLVLDGPCSLTEYNDQPFVRDYLTKNGPCEDYVKFGIHTPLEFMGSLKGDCDTRTLLLYLLFRKFEYDVVILGSAVHQHAVLGVNLPADGVFKWHENKKYFIWETTSPGFELGVFPSEVSDMNDWSVILPMNINF